MNDGGGGLNALYLFYISYTLFKYVLNERTQLCGTSAACNELRLNAEPRALLRVQTLVRLRNS
jgi:hypothetical protein